MYSPDRTDWIKNNKATLSIQFKCFQYALTVALNHKINQKRSTKNNKN